MPKSSVHSAQLKRRARFNLLKVLERRAEDEMARANEDRPERLFREQPRPEVNDEIDGDGNDMSGESDVEDIERINGAVRAGNVRNVRQVVAPRVNEQQYAVSEFDGSDIDPGSDNNDDDDDDDVVDEDGGARDEYENEAEVHPGDDIEEGENGDNDDIQQEDDEDDEDEMQWNLIGNRPLYRGAALNVLESVAAIITFMIDHNLDSSTVNDLIKLIHLHCPQENLVTLSMYKLKKYFAFTSGPVKKHFYCSSCMHQLETREAICAVCARRKGVSYFVQTPLIPQLKRLYSRPSFYDDLQHRFFRRRQNEGCIEDIYDGQLYREAAGFLAEPNNFSMTYFVDSVPVFKSKNYSFWGFYLTINELPYKERVKRENTLLAGVWLGKKCNENLFMGSFIGDFRRLFRGVQIYAASLEQEILVKGMVIAGVADTPARSSFYNSIHHNGFYGCPLCEIRGETHNLPNGNDTHAYRYEQNLELRTVQGVLAQARQALEINDSVRGVKGPTCLRMFMPDYLRGTGIDIMHLVQGLMKKMIEILFGSKNAGHGFSLREVLGVVNRLLLSMKPPRFIHRYPRKLDDWHYWKASELFVFFFYFSVVIFKEVMRPRHYDHYLKLVIALSYLSAQSVSQEMIIKADQLLHEFVRDFPDLYGLHFCSINIHMLLHLSNCVKEIGPLFTFSCFSYENINGQIRRDIHGKTNVDSQITRMHWENLKLPSRILNLREGPVKDYCLKRHGKLKISEQIAQSCYVIGIYLEREVNNNFIAQGLLTSNINFRHVKPYSRLLKEDCVYISERYRRDVRSNSSCAAFMRGGTKCFGCIYIFVKVLQCECGFGCNCDGEHYAIIRSAEKIGNIGLIDEPDTALQYMHLFRMDLNVFAVPVRDLITVCFLMNVEGNMYIAERVNNSKNE